MLSAHAKACISLLATQSGTARRLMHNLKGVTNLMYRGPANLTIPKYDASLHCHMSDACACMHCNVIAHSLCT